MTSTHAFNTGWRGKAYKRPEPVKRPDPAIASQTSTDDGPIDSALEETTGPEPCSSSSDWLLTRDELHHLLSRLSVENVDRLLYVACTMLEKGTLFDPSFAETKNPAA